MQELAISLFLPFLMLENPRSNDDAVKNLGPCVYDTDDNQIILQTAIIDEEGYCHDNHGTY